MRRRQHKKMELAAIDPNKLTAPFSIKLKISDDIQKVRCKYSSRAS